ncbi:MAG: glycosyltransferase [Actinomycetaceae bacterium]|nr:glycosyltransferase [Actinomycetaceae bacterium]
MNTPTEGALILSLDFASGSLRTISGVPTDPRTIALVSYQGRSVALYDGPTEEIQDLLVAASENTGPVARGWDQPDGRPTRLPRASVVVCTMGTSDLLAGAINAILASSVTDFELIVVDNAPSTGATRRALAGVSDERLRIIAAPLPGLSRARNQGVIAAQGEVIVFTDDDAIVDAHWLRGMLEPFAVDTGGLIGGVTGIVLPLELAHRTQRWFESRGGFPKDLRPSVWMLGPIPPELITFGSRGEGGPLHPYTTARVGAGVCMAFRTQVLRAVGPFDTALGAGTPTRGGEDLDIFARVLRGGWAIIHTPDAVVHHRHRRDEEGLYTQIRGNGSGTSALLTKTIAANPLVILDIAAKVPAVARRLNPGSARVAGSESDVPGDLTKVEALGFLEGPLAYLKARRRAGRKA